MPKLPVYTAQGQGTGLQVHQVNSEALGGQVGRDLIDVGQTFSRIDQALQDQRDKLDLAALDADYKLGLDTAYQEALKEPDIQKQPMAFAKQVDALNGDLMKRPLSSAVRTTFAAHREGLDTHAVIALRHEGRALETERQIVTTTQTAEQRMDQAATYSQLGPDARNTDIVGLSGMATALVAGLEQNRHLSPVKAQALKESLQDRYWSEFARQHPDEMLAMRAGGPNANRPIGLDWGKLAHYEQVATLAMHQTEQALQAEDKRLHAAQKAESQAVQQDYYKRSTEPEHDPQALLEEAGQDSRLRDELPQTVTYLQARVDHAKSTAGKSHFDESWYLRTLLPGIYSGTFVDEMAVLKAGAGHLDAPHMTQAIEQLHTYKNTVTAPIKQTFQFGEELIKQAFSLPPGATIDAAGVGEARGRAMDRFTTWYGQLVQRATKEGPKVFDGLDLQAEARKIRDDEAASLDDNVIRILETNPPKFKSEEEIRKAHESGTIGMREVNLYLAELERYQQLQQRAAKRTKPATSGKRVEP